MKSRGLRLRRSPPFRGLAAGERPEPEVPDGFGGPAAEAEPLADGPISPSLVTLRAEGHRAPFRDGELAGQIFAVTARHPATLAACLLPDRLLWLLRAGWDVAETVGRFKAYSNRLAHEGGLCGPLWGHLYHELAINGRSEEVARLLVETPLHEGLVQGGAVYPWQMRRG